MPVKPDKGLLWLSKYLSLALVLPASVVAGYFVGALADRYLHAPILRAMGVLLGMAGGIVKIVQELSRDEQRSR
jgi:F0F1-type ATP synthase assembly protein I